MRKKLLRFLQALLVCSLIITYLPNVFSISSSAENDYPDSYIDIGRTDVYSRAGNMASVKWYVSAANKTIYSSNVTLPAYVNNATVGTRLTGIPYCWGGFNGYEDEGTDYTVKSFLNVVTGNYTAGNIDCDTSGLQSSTIGLDCSGYVSSAYGLSNKKGTGGLAASSFGRTIDYDRLMCMDYLVKSGDHTVLFYQEYVIGTTHHFMIYDSSTNAEKVSCRSLERSYFYNNSYICKTPWHVISDSSIGTSSDTHIATYTNPTSHHWYCVDCGADFYQSHVYEQNSNTCIFCGEEPGTW